MGSTSARRSLLAKVIGGNLLPGVCFLAVPAVAPHCSRSLFLHCARRSRGAPCEAVQSGALLRGAAATTDVIVSIFVRFARSSVLNFAICFADLMQEFVMKMLVSMYTNSDSNLTSFLRLLHEVHTPRVFTVSYLNILIPCRYLQCF